jgi:hypothetical protein
MTTALRILTRMISFSVKERTRKTSLFHELRSNGFVRSGRPYTFAKLAGEGNRTLVSSLGSWRSTIELHPRENCRL